MEEIRKALDAACGLPEEEMEPALIAIRDKYTLPKQKQFILDYMLAKADEIGRQIDEVGKELERIASVRIHA